MSQHNLQQRLHQDIEFAPSERPKRRRPIAAANRPVITALALTASFIMAALIHVSSYARLAQLEYRRQALVAEAARIDAANSQLRFEVERARGQERVTGIAQQWGMALADPACEVDYIVLPAAAGPGSHPRYYAVLRDLALEQQVTSIVTTGWGGAVQTAAAGQRVARP
jgi:cell division protein FtsL